MNKNIVIFYDYLNEKFPTFKDIFHTFEKCSRFGKAFLVHSKIKTINFDILTKWVHGCNPPQSADSLSFSDECLYLIEFKSGEQTKPDKKTDKLISNVSGKINDSDNTLSELYSEAFDNNTRLKQIFCLVVDSKFMGITPLVTTLANLSVQNNELLSDKEKIIFNKILPDLKSGIASPDHYFDVEIWYSELFEQYIAMKGIKSQQIIDF